MCRSEILGTTGTANTLEEDERAERRDTLNLEARATRHLAVVDDLVKRYLDLCCHASVMCVRPRDKRDIGETYQHSHPLTCVCMYSLSQRQESLLQRLAERKLSLRQAVDTSLSA